MAEAEAGTCPRCGATLASGQAYCLECGLRQPGHARIAPSPTRARDLRLRIAALGALAVAGGAVAIAVAATGPGPETVVTATGGSVAAPSRPAAPGPGLARWSRTEAGWTIVLVSVPKTRGRDEAVAVAQQARTHGLRTVGVLDSSLFASLRPGYWMTFAGRYGSQAEATSSLRRARAAVKGARVAQVEP